MRLSWIPFVLLIAACQGGGDTTSPDDAGLPAARVTLSGRVYDSLTGAPLDGVYLAIGDKVAQTASDGGYQASVLPGDIVVRVRFGLYEEFRATVPAHGPTRLDLPLRRLHPALMACAIASDSIRAVIVELQGRKTLNRGEGSLLQLSTVRGDTTVSAWDWSWQPVDAITWRASVATAGRAVTRAVWTLRDKQGFGDRVDCSTVPAPPAFPDPEGPNPS